jgi:hypothetical protein
MSRHGLEGLLLICKCLLSPFFSPVLLNYSSDQWAALVKDQRWSWSGLLRYFKKSETFYPTPEQRGTDVSAIHGFDGPIKVNHSFAFWGLRLLETDGNR